jgi:hypothetical protein
MFRVGRMSRVDHILKLKVKILKKLAKIYKKCSKKLKGQN